MNNNTLQKQIITKLTALISAIENNGGTEIPNPLPISHNVLTELEACIASNKVNVSDTSLADLLTLLQTCFKMQFDFNALPVFTLCLNYLIGGRGNAASNTDYSPPFIIDISNALSSGDALPMFYSSLFLYHSDAGDNNVDVTVNYWDQLKTYQTVTASTGTNGTWVGIADNVVVLDSIVLPQAAAGYMQTGVPNGTQFLSRNYFSQIINQGETIVTPKYTQGIPRNCKYQLGTFFFNATGDHCYFRIWLIQANRSNGARKEIKLFETLGYLNHTYQLDLRYLGWFQSLNLSAWCECLVLSSHTVGNAVGGDNIMHLELRILW